MSIDLNKPLPNLDNTLPRVVVYFKGAKIVNIETSIPESPVKNLKSIEQIIQEQVGSNYRNERSKVLMVNLITIQLESPTTQESAQQEMIDNQVPEPPRAAQRHEQAELKDQVQEQAEEPVNGEQVQEQAEELVHEEQVQAQAEEEVEAAEQAAAAPEEVPENVLEELSLLSHGTTAHTEQEQSQQSSRSTYTNKNAVESETRKGTKTPDKTHPALREQSAHMTASAAMKKHMNGELRSGPQGKMQDPSSMKADPRLASPIRDKNAPMRQSASKNWNMIRAEFKQILQLSLKNSEPLLNGKSSGNAPSTTAQGTAAGNFKSTTFLNSSRQSTFSSPDFAATANKQKADAFALGLKLLQMCMGKQLDERFAATGKTIREEIIAGRIPVSASIPKDLKEILTGLLLGKPGPLTIDAAMRMLALSKEAQTAQGLPQALYYSPSQPLAGKPSPQAHAITAIAAIPSTTLLLSNSPMNQESSAEEEEEEEEGESPLIRAVVFGSAEIALDAGIFINELRETNVKVVLLTTEASSHKSYDLTAILKSGEWEKPGWKTQLYLAEQLDVPAEETLFIAKDAKQAVSARALGFEVIEYQSPSQLKKECTKRSILGQKEH